MKIKPKSFHCDVVIAIFIAGIIGLFVGANAKRPTPETCIFDPHFNRWECCANTVQTSHGMRCAVGQLVRIMSNPA